MKSTGQNLEKAYKQGKNYFKGLNDNDLPRYVLICDLNEFRLYDLDDNGKDYRFELENLITNLHLFDFMNGGSSAEIDEFELNEKAALLLGKLHDTLSESNFTGHQLQVFMVRILFCLFAEDTGVFNRHQFVRYLLDFTKADGTDAEMHLQKLFQILNKSANDRNANLSDELNAFPYVNGNLFKELIEMPSFTPSMREQLLECCYFNWSAISPAIFGSLFQSIMDKDSRRNLGAHYTSEENIIKLISPLFLDDLQNQVNAVVKLKQENIRNQKLITLMNKIQSLTFFDPACGCGNFLIITYREIRRLELQILKAQQSNENQSHIGIDIDPQIKLNNFYGIEIDEWPTRIAEVAMWLTQHQMNVEFAKQFGREPDLLPLKEHANIHNKNALEIDWAEVVEKDKLNYIIGNPPFVGKNFRTKEQANAQELVFKETVKSWKSLDFVTSWFYKSAQFIQ
ncbi:MAG: class I SAM-dependent DNA methyltransferase, partial [Candidatus Thioglobus sp.]